MKSPYLFYTKKKQQLYNIKAIILIIAGHNSHHIQNELNHQIKDDKIISR